MSGGGDLPVGRCVVAAAPVDEYMIVSAPDPARLTTVVNLKIASGWVPVGGMVVVPVTAGWGWGFTNPASAAAGDMVSCEFFQTMTRTL